MWKMLDDMVELDFDVYKKFIDKVLKDGVIFFKLFEFCFCISIILVSMVMVIF